MKPTAVPKPARPATASHPCSERCGSVPRLWAEPASQLDDPIPAVVRGP